MHYLSAAVEAIAGTEYIETGFQNSFPVKSPKNTVSVSRGFMKSSEFTIWWPSPPGPDGCIDRRYHVRSTVYNPV